MATHSVYRGHFCLGFSLDWRTHNLHIVFTLGNIETTKIFPKRTFLSRWKIKRTLNGLSLCRSLSIFCDPPNCWGCSSGWTISIDLGRRKMRGQLHHRLLPVDCSPIDRKTNLRRESMLNMSIQEHSPQTEKFPFPMTVSEKFDQNNVDLEIQYELDFH